MPELSSLAMSGKLTHELLAPHIDLTVPEQNLRSLGLTVVVRQGWFEVYDQRGYVCRTKSVDALMAMLMLQNIGTCREIVNPATTPLPSGAQQRARDLAEQMRNKLAAGPSGTPGGMEVHGGYGTTDPGAGT